MERSLNEHQRQQSDGRWSLSTRINFFVLLFIRGTTPLMVLLGMRYLHSPSLVVALKCEISLVMFTLSAVCLLRDTATRNQILSNFQERSTYWKLLVSGCLHSVLPYFLIAYSVQYLPITLVSAFTVSTPWFVAVVERCCSRSSGSSSRNRCVHHVGMFIGLLGLIVMVTATIMETMHCFTHDGGAVINGTIVTNNTVVVNNSTNGTNHSVPLFREVPIFESLNNSTSLDCTPLHDVIIGVTCLAFAPISWAIAAVFWKHQRGEIHHVVANIGRNAFGGVVALLGFIIFGALTDFGSVNWTATDWIFYVAFLGIASGWLGTILVQNVFAALGPRLANQVLTGMPLLAFVEDCLFVRHPFSLMNDTPNTFVAQVVGLVALTVGLFASNIPDKDDPSSSFTYVDMQEGSVTERLLPTAPGLDYPDDNGLDYPDNEEILRNDQLIQYEGLGGDDGFQTDLVPLDTEDIKMEADLIAMHSSSQN